MGLALRTPEQCQWAACKALNSFSLGLEVLTLRTDTAAGSLPRLLGEAGEMGGG